MPVSMLPVFLMVASLASVEGFHKGSCLGYDVLCTTADYQFRRYHESVWVGTHARHGRPDVLTTTPLFRYLRGDNLAGMRMRHPGQYLISLSGDRVLTNYVMLPEKFWDNPPAPTDPRVFITRFPVMDVFARIIPGFRFTVASDFNCTLTEQNVPVNNSNFFVSFCIGYSAIFPSLLAGQEIWFVSTKEFDCPDP